MEFVISERGKKHLCLDGYRYLEKNQLKNGLIKWQCTFGNCRAVGYLDEQQEFTLKTEHAHLPSPSKIQANKFANEVREKPQTPVTLPDRLFSTPKLTCLFMQRPQYRVTQHPFEV